MQCHPLQVDPLRESQLCLPVIFVTLAGCSRLLLPLTLNCLSLLCFRKQNHLCHVALRVQVSLHALLFEFDWMSMKTLALEVDHGGSFKNQSFFCQNVVVCAVLGG